MTKTLIDIDDELLASAAAVLGTSTKRSTVEAALRELIARHRRLAGVEALQELGFIADLADPGFEGRAWG
jgi:Arc/MetJ family transcription regulator